MTKTATVPKPDGSSKKRLRKIRERQMVQYGDHDEIHGDTPKTGGIILTPEVLEYMRRHGVTRIVARAE